MLSGYIALTFEERVSNITTAHIYLAASLMIHLTLSAYLIINAISSQKRIAQEIAFYPVISITSFHSAGRPSHGRETEKWKMTPMPEMRGSALTTAN